MFTLGSNFSCCTDPGRSLRPCLHDTRSPMYRIPFYVGLGLCSSNLVQLCSPSAGGTKMNQVQSLPFCFTCKHRNPVQNALKPRFDNRMASNAHEGDRLFGTQAKKTRNIIDVMKLFWHKIVSLGCFPGFV